MPHVEGLHPELKKWAYRAFRRARRSKRIVPPERCEKCGGDGGPRGLVAHHESYSAPLAVRWYCRACHVLVHQGGSVH